jgi:hypothetical protein
MYLHRPIAGIMPPHRHWWWSRRRPTLRSWRTRRINTTALCAMTPMRWHLHNNIVLHVEYVVVLLHVRHTMTPSGSSPPVQQKKKYLDWRIRQPYGVRYEENPLTCWHDSKLGRWAKGKEEERWRRGERRGELFKELPQSTCVKLSSRGPFI